MKPRVYIETTIIGYLMAWPSRNIVFAARQQITKQWWTMQQASFDLVTSDLVVQEAGDGDPVAARERLDAMSQLPLLVFSDAAGDLAKHLLFRGALPAKASADALHVALCAVNGIDYLLTWNCRHLANAAMRDTIDSACTERGYRPPVICTPEELMGV